MHNHKTLYITLYITRRNALHQVLANCYFSPLVPGHVDGIYSKLKTITKFTVVQNLNEKVLNTHILTSLKQFTALPPTFIDKYGPPSNIHPYVNLLSIRELFYHNFLDHYIYIFFYRNSTCFRSQ